MKKITGKIKKDMKIILKEMIKNNLALEEYIEMRKKKAVESEEQEHLRKLFVILDEEKYISTGVKDRKAFSPAMIYENWGLDYETFVTEKGMKFVDWKTKFPFIMSSIAAVSSILVLILQIIEVLK